MTNQSANLWSPKENVAYDATDRIATEPFTVTAATQAAFNLLTFSYVMSTNALLVYKNGLLLTKGTQWVEQTPTSFLLVPAAVITDVVVAVGMTGVTIAPTEAPALTAYLPYSTQIANFSDATILTGYVIRTTYFDDNMVIGSGAAFKFTGVTTEVNAGNGAHTDGYFYDALGNQFVNINIFLDARQWGMSFDGTTDDGAAYRKAIAYMNAVGGILNFPSLVALVLEDGSTGNCAEVTGDNVTLRIL